ncbi:hypothetical protein V5T82_13000 [Magnetovibrio sp. PR-2]|uniref:hypothetical protein n=1 Tax=Magnetovibrio sp. PR-2 TaxID=3120356 RepID=UPI002FCE2E08
MKRTISVVLVSLAALFGATSTAMAETVMKPFILSSVESGSVEARKAQVSAKLDQAGFDIVGTYAPFAGAEVLIVTNDHLKKQAAKTEFGAYGAAQRISITDMNGEIQVAYTNPAYMAAAYRMDADMAPVAQALETALGNQGEFGPEEGMTADDLEDYHYMFLMPYFDDPNRLGSAKSYTEMVERIETNLAQGVGGASKVYRIDIPGKESTVFGIGLKGEGEEGRQQDDAWVMSEIDFKPTRSTAHLPVEIVVSGKFAWALSARFRIAINFPDLSMTGDNSFMNIMGAPIAIQKAQTLVAGGTYTGDGKYAD